MGGREGIFSIREGKKLRVLHLRGSHANTAHWLRFDTTAALIDLRRNHVGHRTTFQPARRICNFMVGVA